MDELKPCPFCGGKNLTVGGWKEHVRCKDCDAIGPSNYVHEKAVEAWNRREEAL